MKRVGILFVVLVAGLSAGLYFKLRAQQLEAARPSGGSATVEGTEVDVVSRLMARVTAVHVDEGDVVERGQLLVELECDEQRAALAQADAAVEAARVSVAAAEVGAALAQQGVETAKLQVNAAEAATAVSKAQLKAGDVRARAARRRSKRVGTVHRSGAASEQILDGARSEAAGLREQARALRAGLGAAEAQVRVAEGAQRTAAVRVDLAAQERRGAEKALAAAEAARRRAAVAVAECRLVAPRSGVVQTRHFEPGEVALPGSRLLSLVDVGTVRATFYLPNAELGVAAPGGTVRVVADAWDGAVFEGRIRRVATSAEFTPRNVQTREDRDRLVYAVEIEVPNPDGQLRPGMPIEVEIPGTGREAD